MKIIFSLFLLTFTLPLYSDFAFASDIAGSIQVEVSNLQNDDGTVDIALVKNSDELKSDDVKPFMGTDVKSSGGTASCVFKSVPYGTYAIKVYHDENGNGVFDKGAFGIPKEEYGFSNIPASKKGRPSFDKSSFELSTSELDVKVEMKK